MSFSKAKLKRFNEGVYLFCDSSLNVIRLISSCWRLILFVFSRLSIIRFSSDNKSETSSNSTYKIERSARNKREQTRNEEKEIKKWIKNERRKNAQIHCELWREKYRESANLAYFLRHGNQIKLRLRFSWFLNFYRFICL